MDLEVRDVKNIFKTLRKGQAVYLRTQKQELLGRLHLIDINQNFIFLDILKDVKANVEYTSRQMIPAEMVKYVAALDSLDDVVSFPSSSSSSSDMQSLPKNDIETLPQSGDHPRFTVNLTPYEIKLLKIRMDNAIVINQKDQDYSKAIDHIKAEQVIALFVEPTKFGRNFKTSIITVATVRFVFIFDIVTMGKLFNDFKNILESPIPLKAIHGCHLVADHFKYQHNVELNGIFDTFAAYCIVNKTKRHIDFPDIVEQIFSIDKNFFDSFSDASNYPQNTLQRPLKPKFIREYAKRASFILKLQEHLNNKMLSKFFNQCKDFSRTYLQTEDDCAATEMMQINPSAGLETLKGLDPHDQTI